MPRKTYKKLRAIFEPKPRPRLDEIHLRLRPDEGPRWRMAVAAVHADSLSSWLRQLAHAECDRLGIPRG